MKLISILSVVFLALTTAVIASPTMNLKRKCIEKHCDDANLATCCLDTFGYSDTDTGDCHCERDYVPW